MNKKDKQSDIFKKLLRISSKNYGDFFLVLTLISLLGILELFSVLSIYPIFINVTNVSANSESIIIEKLYEIYNSIGFEFNLINTSLIFSLILLVKFVAEFLINRYLIKYINRRISFIRQTLMKSYLSLSWKDTKDLTVGAINSIIVTEIERLRGCIMVLFKFTSAILFALAFLATALISNLKLFLLFFILGLSKYFISYPLQKGTIKDGFNLSTSINEISEDLSETHSNIKSIKIHKVKNFFLRNLINTENSIKFINISIGIKKQLLRSLDEFLIYLSGIVFLSISIIIFKENIAEIIISGILLMRGVRKISEFQVFIQRINSNHGLVTKVLDIYDSWLTKNNEIKKKKTFHPKKNIKLKNVTIGFEDKQIIKKINLKIEFGKIYFLEGDSGIGKTCLVDSIIGLNQILGGQILVDDQKVQIHKNELWFDGVSYVSQETGILNLSLKDNIVFGRKFDETKLNFASDIVSLNNIGNFMKSNMPLGEKGNKISGGQKQRIGIAREFYDLQKILILDEATSAIDKRTSDKIFSRIQKIIRGTKILVILISHDKKNIKYCDEIIKINNKGISKIKVS